MGSKKKQNAYNDENVIYVVKKQDFLQNVNKSRYYLDKVKRLIAHSTSQYIKRRSQADQKRYEAYAQQLAVEKAEHQYRSSATVLAPSLVPVSIHQVAQELLNLERLFTEFFQDLVDNDIISSETANDPDFRAKFFDGMLASSNDSRREASVQRVNDAITDASASAAPVPRPQNRRRLIEQNDDLLQRLNGIDSACERINQYVSRMQIDSSLLVRFGLFNPENQLDSEALAEEMASAIHNRSH
jgi:hypothetical protein